jgi:hypothetical protein
MPGRVGFPPDAGTDAAPTGGIAYGAGVTRSIPSPASLVADPPVFVLPNEIGIIDQVAQNRVEAVQPDGLRLSHFVLLNHLVRAGDDTHPARVAHAPQLAKACAGLEAVLPRAAMEALIPHLRASRECLARAWDIDIWAPQT